MCEILDLRLLDLGASWRWSASGPAALPPVPGIGGCVGPRTGLDDMEKITFLSLERFELRPLSCPARNQSLYRLRYGVMINNLRGNCTQLQPSPPPY
jgi:hypothetical protein